MQIWVLCQMPNSMMDCYQNLHQAPKRPTFKLIKWKAENATIRKFSRNPIYKTCLGVFGGLYRAHTLCTRIRIIGNLTTTWRKEIKIISKVITINGTSLPKITIGYCENPLHKRKNLPHRMRCHFGSLVYSLT